MVLCCCGNPDMCDPAIRSTAVILLQYCCNTVAILVQYCCNTAAILLKYCCNTAFGLSALFLFLLMSCLSPPICCVSLCLSSSHTQFLRSQPKMKCVTSIENGGLPSRPKMIGARLAKNDRVNFFLIFCHKSLFFFLFTFVFTAVAFSFSFLVCFVLKMVRRNSTWYRYT